MVVVDELTRVRMEGSTHYLYSDTALNFTSEISPRPQHLLKNQLSYITYFECLSNWLIRIPRDHIKILILENLARRERRDVQEIADWLGVDPSYYDDYKFETVNKTRSRAFKTIRRRVGRYRRFFPKAVTRTIKSLVDGSVTP